MNKNNWPPFYIEPPTMSQQFRDFADTVKTMEEWIKAQKPKEEKKDEKKNTNVFKNWLLLGLASPFLILFFMWAEFTIFIDILEKAQAIKLK
jgi:hypothetical protein